MHASSSHLKLLFNKLYSHGDATNFARYTLTNGDQSLPLMSMSDLWCAIQLYASNPINCNLLLSWVSKEARPISLRQLMVFGRSLNEQRLISSANYVRTELPRRYVVYLEA